VSFWIIVVLLCLLAIGFAAWPLWSNSHRLTPLVATVIVFTVAVSAGLYNHVGSPGVPSGRSTTMGGGDELPGMEEAVASLEKRLENDPDDLNGWKMLGRTHQAMGNFEGAVAAFERAVELENGQVAQTLIDLAIAITNRDQAPLQAGRAMDLIDSALKLDPTNQPALFYSGVAAANKGDTETAASLWERLLELNPPADIRGILEQNIATWRGEEPPATASEPSTSAAVAAEPVAVPDDAVISAQISLSAAAQAAMPSDAVVFVIARDPTVPVPPIAVSRRMLRELPATVSLTDAQSMVEGRVLSAFAEIELLARVSLSGGPAAQPGDWFGSLIVKPAENAIVTLIIDQQVP
jgi:cytochrome c-type biogenesis protein CcmH